MQYIRWEITAIAVLTNPIYHPGNFIPIPKITDFTKL